MTLIPHIWPMSDGLVVSGSAVFEATSTTPKLAAVILKACRDGFGEEDGVTPEQAWSAVEKDPDCPTLIMTFHTVEKIDQFIGQLENLKAKL